jgi:hypothetical protein
VSLSRSQGQGTAYARVRAPSVRDCSSAALLVSMSGSTTGLVLLLAAQAAMSSEPAPAKFDQIRSCTECIAAGFGWSVRKGKCGHFANFECHSSPAAARPRPVLKHRLKHSEWLPRVTVSELQKNATLRSGGLPFVLVGAMEGWPARGLWNVSHFAKAHADEHVDFFARGLKDFFTDYSEGVEWPDAARKFEAGRLAQNSPYIIWRNTLESWNEIAPQISPLPTFFDGQTALLRECLASGVSQAEGEERWSQLFDQIIWRMVMIGQVRFQSRSARSTCTCGLGGTGLGPQKVRWMLYAASCRSSIHRSIQCCTCIALATRTHRPRQRTE